MGVSFGGHYAPSLGAYIVNQDDARINLKGVGLSSPWTDPLIQMGSQTKYAYENGLLNWFQRIYIRSAYFFGQACLFFKWYSPAGNVVIFGQEEIFGNPPAIDPYDIKAVNSTFNTTAMKDFMELHAEDFGVNSGRDYEMLNSTVFSLLFPEDFMMSAIDEVSLLLNSNIYVLNFYGQNDFVCNWIGGLEWNNDVSWSGKSSYNNLGLQNLTYWDRAQEEVIYGVGKQYKNFAYVNVFNGSHGCGHPQGPPQYLIGLLVGNQTI